MFTELEIKSPESRAYVEYYFDGIRQREYNAKRLELRIFPNKAKSQSEKNKLLSKLKFEFHKALEKGWNPLSFEKPAEKKAVLSLENSVKEILKSKLNENYSRSYKKDLVALSGKFLQFLTSAEKKCSVDKLETSRVIEFLEQFNSSNRNYMNKRQTLNVLLPNTISRTPRKKCNEQLHEIYTKEEMKEVLAFLKKHYPKLHLLSLLAYGCFLRPHEESRLLQKRHIKEHKIYLSGNENKGKKIRVVDIPNYVYEALLPFIENCENDNSYIFTGTNWLINDDYFKTMWSRAKNKMKAKSLIKENQTLYSFRHSASVNVYKKIKDIYILQKLLGHSSIIVTMKYLRGLGEVNSEELRDALPEL